MRDAPIQWLAFTGFFRSSPSPCRWRPVRRTASSAGSGGTGGKGTGTGGAPGDAGGTTGTGRDVQCQGTGPNGFNPYKYLYYGELHLHTSYSLDAYSFGTRSDPKNAYLFAKGQATVHVGEGSAAGGPIINQDRPIDFLAVTDHSEWLSVTHGCTVDAKSGYYNASDCGLVRSSNPTDEILVLAENGSIEHTLCSGDQAACVVQEKTAWQELIAAANGAYVPCKFTSLVGYEWTSAPLVIDQSTNKPASVTNHRNVIFANDNVPGGPLGALDYPTPPELWTGLGLQCRPAFGCNVVTIPHNSNLSAGISLVVWDPTPAGVAQQRRYQVSAEIYQHKGASECYYDPANGYTDADCQFEYPGGKNAINVGPASFVREALGTGIGYAAANTGQGNPLELGIVGGTDDHNGAPGSVDEATYVGHAGNDEDTAVKRLVAKPEDGPGAITGVWAEQNTRESLFAAIKRRETFATSGPRLSVRFYETSDAMACADPAFPKKILDAGTAFPMGSTFANGALGGAAAPTFAIAAWPDALAQKLADDTTAVAGLAAVQVIKVHASVSGGAPVVVEDPPYLVSGVPATGGCATWTDPSFDPTSFAVYYVRVLQVPTWRWSHWSCQEVEQSNPSNWQTLVPGCMPGGGLDVSIQERAWTSPNLVRAGVSRRAGCGARGSRAPARDGTVGVASSLPTPLRPSASPCASLSSSASRSSPRAPPAARGSASARRSRQTSARRARRSKASTSRSTTAAWTGRN